MLLIIDMLNDFMDRWPNDYRERLVQAFRSLARQSRLAKPLLAFGKETIKVLKGEQARRRFAHGGSLFEGVP
jgi:hypothetical protein